jgi:predicted TIM-barrel fold metal-dependent hydrolase
MRIIDAWVNAELPRNPAAWQKQVVESVFKKSASSIFRAFTADELLHSMDEAGVQKALLTLIAAKPSKTLREYANRHPDRFAFSAIVDPTLGMTALRQLDSVVRSHDVRLARVIPSMHNAPPDDRLYYPLYAKCVDLRLPISINTGIPGPPLPGKCQHPIALDDVCLFFPELTVVMANGADPWWDIAIRLMAKYPNLYMMTSAYAPKYLPEALLRFMDRRDPTKVMFATDFPFLGMARCASDARELKLSPAALERYLYDNAAEVLFGGRGAAQSTESPAAQ